MLEKWSLEHHVVGMDSTLSRSFTDELSRRVLETLDPHRVLFTQDDLSSLSKLAPAAWEEVLKQKSCKQFAAWVDARLASAKERLYDHLGKQEFDAKKISRTIVDSSETKFKNYKTTAASLTELKERWARLYDEILKSAYPKLLESYSHNLEAYVTDSIQQILEHKMPSGDMLAKAMLRSVDEYSNFLSSEEYADFYDDLAGGTSGIGIKIRKTPKGLLIEKVLDDSPAQKSKKIIPGDQVLAVDGKRVAKLPLNETKDLLKGKPGAGVSLLLERTEKTHNLQFTIRLKRQRFNFDEGKVEVSERTTPEGTILVATVPSFYGRGSDPGAEDDHSVSEDLERELKKRLKKKTPKAIVMDLRDNPGGYLEEAVDMAGLFIGNKTVAGVMERNSRRVFKNEYQAPLFEGPLVVLLDSGSASAAEVFAGAMKDHQRAVLIGSPTTYGKGTVQRLYHVENELPLMDLSGQLLTGVIKLTTSVFYSPLGHSPANGGVRTHVTLLPESLDGEHPKHKSLAAIDFDVNPFLSEPEVERLKNTEKERQPLLETLRAQSRSRIGTEKELSERQALDEAISLAGSWSTLLQRSSVAARAE
ncbi:MAG: PDZ domain-containing protein [Bdellovibrionaceae bacterium]|nr:PDZ domain-containing protein [Pseudobdellovibrionaceae bacterium]